MMAVQLFIGQHLPYWMIVVFPGFSHFLLEPPHPIFQRAGAEVCSHKDAACSFAAAKGGGICCWLRQDGSARVVGWSSDWRTGELHGRCATLGIKFSPTTICQYVVFPFSGLSMFKQHKQHLLFPASIRTEILITIAFNQWVSLGYPIHIHDEVPELLGLDLAMAENQVRFGDHHRVRTGDDPGFLGNSDLKNAGFVRVSSGQKNRGAIVAEAWQMRD